MPDDAVEINAIPTITTTYEAGDWDVVHQGGLTRRILAEDKAQGISDLLGLVVTFPLYNADGEVILDVNADGDLLGGITQAQIDALPMRDLDDGDKTRVTWGFVIRTQHDAGARPVRAFFASAVGVYSIEDTPELASTVDSGKFATGELALARLAQDVDVSGVLFQRFNRSVTNIALTTNVVTLTVGAAHGIIVGQYVLVTSIASALSAEIDSQFNGTYVVTAIGATTISYVRGAADVASTAATGNVEAQGLGEVFLNSDDYGTGQAWLEGSARTIQLQHSGSHVADLTYYERDDTAKKLTNCSFDSNTGSTTFTVAGDTYVKRIVGAGAGALYVLARADLGRPGAPVRLGGISFYASEPQRMDGYNHYQAGGGIDFVCTTFGPRSNEKQRWNMDGQIGALVRYGSGVIDPGTQLPKKRGLISAAAADKTKNFTSTAQTLPSPPRDFWLAVEDPKGFPEPTVSGFPTPMYLLVNSFVPEATVEISYTGWGVGDGVTLDLSGAASSPGQSYIKGCIVGAAVSNKALTSDVATLTTATAHGFRVADSVTVEGVDATFNGTYTVVAVPTTTTFTYAKVAGNVASAAATGTAVYGINAYSGATISNNANVQLSRRSWYTVIGSKGDISAQDEEDASGHISRTTIGAVGPNTYVETAAEGGLQIGNFGHNEWILYRKSNDLAALASGDSLEFPEFAAFAEVADPGVAAANTVRVFAIDDAAGGTVLKARFPTGIAQTILREAGVFVLTDGANIATDASKGPVFTDTLTGNRNMAAPSNPTNGQRIIYVIRQDGTGGRTLTWNAIFRFSSDYPTPVLSAAAGATDVIEFIYNLTDNTWDCIRTVGLITQQHRWINAIELRVPTGGTASFGQTAGGVLPAWALDGAGATETLQVAFGVPDAWLTMAVDVHWCNDGAGAGNVRFSTEHLAVAAAGDYAAARTTTLLTVTAAAQNIKKVTTLVTPVSLATARSGVLRVTRLSADAADTLTNDIAIVGVNLRCLT